MNTLKLLKKAACISALPLLLSLTQVGCGGAGVSSVAQGQRYESGDPTYDRFFEQVHELSLELGKAPQAEGQVRMALAKELGVEPEEEDEPAPAAAKPSEAPATAPAAPSPTDAYEAQLKQSAINAIPGAATVNAVSAQVDQARQTVGQLKSMFGGSGAPSQAAARPAPVPAKKDPKPPSASLISKAVKSRAATLGYEMKLTVVDAGEAKTKMLTRGESTDGAKLAGLVEKAAQRELVLAAKMTSAKQKLAKLATLGSALEANADVSFRKSRSKLGEVKKNLADAKALIELMDTRASEVSKKATQMVEKLEAAASASLDDQAPAPSTEKAAAATEPKTQPNPAAEPEKKAAAAAAKPKAKPRPRVPARPAKTAMADFEP